VELALTALGPRGREAAGHEEVPGVAVLDLDDVPGGTEAGDLVGEDELGGHGVPFLAQRPEVEYCSRAISRAFFTAFAILRCSWSASPVTRRARILPRSAMNLRSSAASLYSAVSIPAAFSWFSFVLDLRRAVLAIVVII